MRQSLDRGFKVSALVPGRSPFRTRTTRLAVEPSDRRVPCETSVSSDDVRRPLRPRSTLAICLSGTPFRPDSTTPVVRNHCRLFERVARYAGVRAWVGDSVQDRTSEYSHEQVVPQKHHDAKKPGRMVSSLSADVDVVILRPRVLSFGSFRGTLYHPRRTSREPRSTGREAAHDPLWRRRRPLLREDPTTLRVRQNPLDGRARSGT